MAPTSVKSRFHLQGAISLNRADMLRRRGSTAKPLRANGTICHLQRIRTTGSPQCLVAALPSTTKDCNSGSEWSPWEPATPTFGAFVRPTRSVVKSKGLPLTAASTLIQTVHPACQAAVKQPDAVVARGANSCRDDTRAEYAGDAMTSGKEGTNTMWPNPRIPFQMSSERARLEPLDGKPLMVNSVVNIEYWPFNRPMPRGILPPPHGAHIEPPDVPNYSWVEYGLRCGMPRLFDLMGQRGIKATAFFNAQCAEVYPTLAKATVDAGWELVGHGWFQRSLKQSRGRRSRGAQMLGMP